MAHLFSQVFKEEEDAIKVDLHEGCGRTKLFWVMALADSQTLKAMVEFREGGGAAGAGAVRQRARRFRPPGPPVGAAAGHEAGSAGREVRRREGPQGSAEPGPAGRRWRRDGPGSPGPARRRRRARGGRQRWQAWRWWIRAASSFGRGGPREGAVDHASAEVVGRADIHAARRSEGEYPRAEEADQLCSTSVRVNLFLRVVPVNYREMGCYESRVLG